MEQEEVKSKTTTYRETLNSIRTSRLNAQNKIQAMNTCPTPGITFTAGIIDWNKKELQDINRMTRKAMNMYGGTHPRTDTHAPVVLAKVTNWLRIKKSQEQSASNAQDYISKPKVKDPRSSLEISSNYRVQM